MCTRTHNHELRVSWKSPANVLSFDFTKHLVKSKLLASDLCEETIVDATKPGKLLQHTIKYHIKLSEYYEFILETNGWIKGACGYARQVQMKLAVFLTV